MTRKTWFGHPAGLTILFFTEMWERFSYYGMRSLLVLYLTQYLLLPANGDGVFGLAELKSALESIFGPLAPQALASQLYGLYTGLVYFTPLFGGILADRYLGPRRTVMLGALLMAGGHFLMALPMAFLPALLLLILGNGCFKPNISTQVGGLYPVGDPRRDGAFTIFYMGINLGALFSPLICGTLGQRYGWHYGFAAAGIGMLLGLLVYLLGQRHLPAILPLRNSKQSIQQQALSSQEWQAIGGLLLLALINSLFWAVYEQQGNSLQIFADRHADWRIAGWDMPSTWFQALNPAFIIVLAPLLERWSGRHRQFSSIAKMALGAALLGLAFLVLIVAVANLAPGQKIHLLWLVACSLVLTMGELYFSPVGLSLVSKIAPSRLAGMMMGIWFLSSFFGNYLSGYLGGYYELLSQQQFFLLLAGLAGLTALLIWLSRRCLGGLRI